MNAQINKDNATVYNIENQHNNFFLAGTPFTVSLECKEGNYFESIKNSLYYPPQYMDRVISVLEAEHSILIQGEQGSGKSVLAFQIAEWMKEKGMIVSAYYLNTPNDWNAIKQWIQSVHCQKEWRNEGAHLWIIDNLHRIADAVEDFPDPSVWGQDFCVCCTRDLKELPDEDESWSQQVLSRKQVLRRNIDKETFLKCYHALAGYGIGRNESDFLYQCLGGNLAMLKYVIESGNLPKSLVDWRKEQFIDFNKIYNDYFERREEDHITRDNLDEALKMLFLSQIDFPIPFYLQLNICRTALKNLYFETSDKELEMEHATLAELLTACICSKNRLNDRNIFTECLHWTLSNLVDGRLSEPEQLRQINVFLRSLCCYKFILNQNQTLHEVVLYDKCFLSFLEKNKGIISLSVWKMIMEIVEGDSDVNAVFHDFANSPILVENMKLNSDYDFLFFQDRLSQDELGKVEAMLLSHAEDITKSILDSENEACLMHFLLSLSESAAIKFVEQLQSCDLVRILCCNQSDLVVFARCYSRLGNHVKNILDVKISMDDYRNILTNGASIRGFAYLMSAATDLLREELCGILESWPELMEIIVKKTVKEGNSIGTLSLCLRELKSESAEVLEAFEKAIGVKGYKRLLEAQGTIPILAGLIRYSSPEMRKELSDMVAVRQDLVKILMDRTVEKGSSIGTLSLCLRELKSESTEVLEAFEKAIGVKGYERLLETQGIIPVLVHLIEYSSSKMRKELSDMVAVRPELAKILVDRTVEKGSSIGTLGISLRELKSESTEVLEAFEKAIGVKGYERLLEAQGTIPVLARLIEYSSSKMRKELSDMVAVCPDLVKILMDRTVEKGSSIGTLDLCLRELKSESTEVLEAFEKAIGVKGYERLLEAQGTILILVGLIRRSSPEMRKEWTGLLNDRPELINNLVERTVKKGSSIGTLNVSLRDLGKECNSSLNTLEILIGVDGYFEMFSKCNANSITILRIMACSSISDCLVDEMYANMDIWQESKSYISKESHTILKDFHNDLFYAKKKDRKKFWDFVKDMVTVEEWLAWMEQGATLEEAVFILSSLPLSITKKIADAWLKKSDEMMEGLRLVRQNRNTIRMYEPKMINYLIRKIDNYNHQFFVLVNQEYSTLLENE